MERRMSKEEKQAEKDLANGRAMIVENIPLASIYVDPTFNIRQMDEAHPEGEGANEPITTDRAMRASIVVPKAGTTIKDLAANIKEHGLLQPVLVRRIEPKGKVKQSFALVSGFRRFAAVASLGWESIPASVREMSDEEAYAANTIENVHREGISPGELADRCLFFRENFGKSGDEIARTFKLSKQYVNNLMRMAEKLHQDIWSEARAGKSNPFAAPQTRLIEWSALEEDEQIEHYHAWLKEKDLYKAYCDAYGLAIEDETEEAEDGEDGEGGEDDTKKPAKERRASMKALLALEEALDYEMRTHFAGKSPEWLMGAMEVVLFAIGRVDANGDRPEAPISKPKAPKADTAN